MEKKQTKVDLWGNTDLPKGEIGVKPFPGAKLIAKDLVSEEFFEDDQGRRQGICENYDIALQHAHNPKIDGKGHERVVGEYDGRQILTWLTSKVNYVDDKKQGQEIHYFPDGRIMSILINKDDKAIFALNYGGPNGELTSLRELGDDGKTFDGLQIILGDTAEMYPIPEVEKRNQNSQMPRDQMGKPLDGKTKKMSPRIFGSRTSRGY